MTDRAERAHNNINILHASYQSDQNDLVINHNSNTRTTPFVKIHEDGRSISCVLDTARHVAKLEMIC